MQVYLVGGAVRDKLLGYPSDENDYVVVGASPQQMIDRGFTPVGKDFPVFLHPETKEEYALARTERKTAPGYQGFSFNTDISITLEEDLARRDLTINAIAEDESGEIIDPYNGSDDIKHRILRHVSQAFREDPVRILRIARFAARYRHLGFIIANTTMTLMREMVDQGEADHLVAERVWKEFSRALGERSPEVFLTSLYECGALKVIMPEVNTLVEDDAHKDHQHSPSPLKALTVATQESDDLHIRFAVLFDQMSGLENSADIVDHFCQRLSIPNDYRYLAKMLVQFKHIYNQAQTQSAEALMHLLTSTDALRKPERFKQFLKCCYICAFEQNNEIEKKSTSDFLLGCLAAVHTVEPKSLLAAGFEGKALGEELTRQRIEKIREHLETCKA